jgi:hypothetical protein
VRSYAENTEEERQEWLKNPVTRTFLAEIEAEAQRLQDSMAMDLANGRSADFARASAGGWRELHKMLSLARMDLK